MSTGTTGLITTRVEFHGALRLGFAEVAASGCPELWLCDSDFADWPLGERVIIEQLEAWALSSRKLVLLAHNFDEVARRHARWVEWRRQWSHIVSCRINAELEGGSMPTVFLAPGILTVRLSDAIRHRGRLSRDKAEEIRCKEMIDAVLQRSEEAFPASTTGL